MSLFQKKKSGLVINQVSPTTNFFLTLFMLFMALVFVLPLWLVISVSFSTTDSIVEHGYSFWPHEFSLSAYQYLARIGVQAGRCYLNTIFYSVVGTAASLIVMSMFAYVLSRKDFKGRNFLAFYAFFTTLFGGGLVPSYLLIVKYLKWDDTYWLFLVPGLVSAFNVIILRTFISSTIDESMIESARLDGASDFNIYARIVMPLFKPGLASVGLFTFVGKWNDWMTAHLYCDGMKKAPIMTYLMAIQSSIEQLKKLPPNEQTPEMLEMLKSLPSESCRMALTIIAILPLLICYPFFQKYFIKGLTIGSVKG